MNTPSPRLRAPCRMDALRPVFGRQCNLPLSRHLWTLPLLACFAASAARAADAANVAPPESAHIQQQIDALKQSTDERIKALEAQLNGQQPTTLPPLAAPSAGNAFNPQVSVILSGRYANLQRDPHTWQLNGFVLPNADAGPGSRGFNLSESEIGLSANIDPWFYGALTLSMSSNDSISAEEAFVQTTALSNGMKVKAGRFYSALGYLNEQHAHTWDFVDAPLAYQAFLGGQYKQDGVQGKWLLPTDQFIELSGELGNGANYPGMRSNSNGPGSIMFGARTGGDWGASSSWRTGLSWMRNAVQDRTWSSTDATNNTLMNDFTGTSQLWLWDGVWKWAPNGNGTRINFKLQGEYFHRTEAGDTTTVANAIRQTGSSRSAQSGWYVQGIYQFMPGWRVGLRQDQLHGSSSPQPQRSSVMLDWSPSEFSRLRVQFANDRSRPYQSDQQVFVQYQMSLGAHGAHSY